MTWGTLPLPFCPFPFFPPCPPFVQTMAGSLPVVALSGNEWPGERRWGERSWPQLRTSFDELYERREPLLSLTTKVLHLHSTS